MKILHYINNLGSGGAEKLISDILPAMKMQSLDVELMISNSDVNVEKYTKFLDNHNIKIIDLHKSFYNPFQIISIVRYVNKNKVDIIHAHLFPTQYWLSIASFFFRNNVKLVKTEHSVFNERKKYKALRLLEILIYKRYNKIIAISTEVKSNLQMWIKRNDIVIIQNGVNIKQIREEQCNIDEVMYEFIKPEFYNILMVGRFDGIAKDQKTLVKAIQLLPINFKLYFAGEGYFINEIKLLCEKLDLIDRVVFLGLRQDVYKLMFVVNLNVLSTNFEGLSGVVLESLASRQVFLGSNVVGVKEIVPDSRFLFTAGNVEELVNMILRISKDKKHTEEMVETALSYVEKYDIDYMVSDYIKLYSSIIK